MPAPKPSPIAVFDSGLGGLTVLAELVRLLPGEDFVYFGDTARIPYGTRSPRIVRRYSLEVAEYLARFDIKLFVIACNTATAHAEQELAAKLDVPVIGVIEPGVEALLADGDSANNVGVIGTRATIKSGAYESAIKRRDPQRRVFSRACPLFVPLVEEGWVDKRITSLTAQEYISELVREEVRSLVLGCTHYPLLKGVISEEFPELKLIDSSVETARAVRKLLEERKLSSGQTTGGNVRILVTDITDQMERLETLFVGLDYRSLEEVSL